MIDVLALMGGSSKAPSSPMSFGELFVFYLIFNTFGTYVAVHLIHFCSKDCERVALPRGRWHSRGEPEFDSIRWRNIFAASIMTAVLCGVSVALFVTMIKRLL